MVMMYGHIVTSNYPFWSQTQRFIKVEISTVYAKLVLYYSWKIIQNSIQALRVFVKSPHEISYNSESTPKSNNLCRRGAHVIVTKRMAYSWAQMYSKEIFILGYRCPIFVHDRKHNASAKWKIISANKSENFNRSYFYRPSNHRILLIWPRVSVINFGICSFLSITAPMTVKFSFQFLIQYKSYKMEQPTVIIYVF